MRGTAIFRRDRGVWCLRVRDGRRTVRTEAVGAGPEGEAQAKAMAAEFNRRQGRREAVEDEHEGLTWADALEDYLATYVPQLSKGTRRTYAARVEHLKAELPGAVRDLTARDVQRLAGALGQRHIARCACPACQEGGTGEPALLGARTVNGILRTFRRVARLYGSRLFDGDPLAELGALMGQLERRARAGEVSDPRDAWTHEEVETLLRLAKGRAIYGQLLCALQTGARRGVILGLRWYAVDLRRGVIHFTTQLTDGEEKAMPKWGRAHRAPISDRLRAELKRIRRGGKVARMGNPYVFTTSTGKRWHEGNFTRGWLVVRARAALQGVRPFPFHATRHTFVTWALEGGKSPQWVSSVVGASPEVIFRNYAHAMRETEPDLGFLAAQDSA